MKKTTLHILFLLLTFNCAFGQSYDFETGIVPEDWTALHGSLKITNNHYQGGSASLSWTVDNNLNLSSLIVDIRRINMFETKNKASFFRFYNLHKNSGKLLLEFLGVLNGTEHKKKAEILLDFKGWRSFYRKYSDFEVSEDYYISRIKITYVPNVINHTINEICFDDVNFNNKIIADFVQPAYAVGDAEFISNIKEKKILLLHSNPVDIEVSNNTESEINDFNKLKDLFLNYPLPAKNQQAINASIAFVQSYNISYNEDGSVKGKSILSVDEPTLINFSTHLQTLAYSISIGGERLYFDMLLDHLVDQNVISNGIQYSVSTVHPYPGSRAVPPQMFSILQYCKPEQKTEVLTFLRWIIEYGIIYYESPAYKSKINSDDVYLYLTPYFSYASSLPTEEGTREFKALKRYLDRVTEYTPGSKDMIKTDGVGFHHNAHYNSYMYAYNTWVNYAFKLLNTSFSISVDSYERMKKAVLALYIMATKAFNDTRFTSNSLAGRRPFWNTTINFNKRLFENLLTIGSSLLGAQDDELASAFNYFFKSNRYNVANPTNFEGFHQFNYAHLGIYRFKNWVATMHAPTTYSWGAEIYPNENRFGRYQSHGVLDILYYGSSQIFSGYPERKLSEGGGWDWNVVPGATTVHYTNWYDMTPKQNLTQRFDQYTKSRDFAGALSFGDCGMFVSDFDQQDLLWNAQMFTPTNLTFKKTYFAVDEMIIALGTNINSTSTTLITATNLFQNIINPVKNILIVNGNAISSQYSEVLGAGSNNWLITPAGTGYFIPASNDIVEIKYGSQSSPDDTGLNISNPVEALAVKAYINHGFAPRESTYHFIAFPAATTEKMSDFSQQYIQNPGSVYKVTKQDNSVHAIKYFPRNIFFYSFFENIQELTDELVLSSNRQLLMIQKENENLKISASDPSLNIVPDSEFTYLSQPTPIEMVLKGHWKTAATSASSDITCAIDGENTRISYTLKDGFAKSFALEPFPMSVDYMAKKTYGWQSSDGLLTINGLENDEIYNIYNIQGMLVKSGISNGNIVSETLPGNSIYIIKIISKNKEHIYFKVVV